MIKINFNKFFSFNIKKNIDDFFKRYNKFKIILLSLVSAIFIIPIVYLSIPIFFDYEKSKKKIEDKIYKDFNLYTSINDKVKYNLLPSPRINIKNLIIKDFVNKKINLGEVESASLKIPFKKLATLNKINFSKLELNNPKINFDLNKIKKYQKYFHKKFKSKDIQINNGNIQLLDNKKYLASIEQTSLKYTTGKKINETTLKGKLFEKDLYINYKNKEKLNTPSILLIKYPSLNFRANIILEQSNETNVTDGTAFFSFNNLKGNLSFMLTKNSIKIQNGNIKHDYLNGKFSGKIDFLPFFKFDSNLDLSSLNFRKISKVLKEMDKDEITKLFMINSKLNGNLNLFIKKIYTTSKLINSLESKLVFSNKNIIIDRMLIDLGKLGAADITGLIKNNDNKINLSFKKNLFIDNPKKFYSRFGVSKKSIDPENMYIAGKFNINRAKIRFDELLVNSKSQDKDLKFYEDEFNQILFENGYKSFFNFYNFKEFIKLVDMEKN